MLPEWMQKEDDYHPEKDGSRFVLSTIKTIGCAMAQIRVQHGHEKGGHCRLFSNCACC